MKKPAIRRRPTHGERTRREILDVAVQLGASEGLEALTIGRLATSVGMSKGGLFAHFGSKEALQLATVDTAYEQFAEEVVAPALSGTPGLSQLRAFMTAYFAYVARRKTRGGCFFTAAALEFDDRAGPVRDHLRELLGQRDLLVRGAIEAAIEVGELRADVDLEQLSFEVVALATGANVAFQMLDRADALERARLAFEARLLLSQRATGSSRTRSGRRAARK